MSSTRRDLLAPGRWRNVRSPEESTSTTLAEVATAGSIRTPRRSMPRVEEERTKAPRASSPTLPTTPAERPNRTRALAVLSAQPRPVERDLVDKPQRAAVGKLVHRTGDGVGHQDSETDDVHGGWITYPGGLGMRAQFVSDVEAAVGSAAVISEPEQLRTYECDGLTSHRVVPGWSYFRRARRRFRPSSASARDGIPFVARGAERASPAAPCQSPRGSSFRSHAWIASSRSTWKAPALPCSRASPTSRSRRPSLPRILLLPTPPASRSARSAAMSPRTPEEPASSTASPSTTCSRAGRPPGRRARQAPCGRPRAGPARYLHRLRGDAGHRHGGRGASAPAAGGRANSSRRLRLDRPRGRGSLRGDRGPHSPRGDRDDGPTHDRGCGGGRAPATRTSPPS